MLLIRKDKAAFEARPTGTFQHYLKLTARNKKAEKIVVKEILSREKLEKIIITGGLIIRDVFLSWFGAQEHQTVAMTFVANNRGINSSVCMPLAGKTGVGTIQSS